MFFQTTSNRNWIVGQRTDTVYSSANSFFIRDESASATRLTIDTNGNVGIGTTSPIGKLTVQGNIEVNYNSTTADSFVRRTFLTAHALVNRGSNIAFGLLDGGGLAGMTVYNTASSASGYNSQFIGFNTHEGNVSTDERMRITQSGYVGIGTFNPNALLQINGDELIYANVAGAVNSNKLIFGSFANTNAAAIYSQTTSASAGDLILAPVASSVITERVRVKSDGKVGIGTDAPTTLLSVGPVGSTSPASGLTFGGDAQANLYRSAEDTIKTDGSLIVAGALTVGTAVNLNSHVYGDKTVTLTTASYTTVLTVNMSSQTSCYVKIGAFGDWSSHGSVAFVSELFIQNGNNAGYGEPGTIITAHDNTRGAAGDKIDIQIVDPAAGGTQNFLIQLKLISATSSTFSSLITYHVMGQKVSVT